jgi:hypothetical protein
MHDRLSTLKDIALGAGLAIVVSGAVLLAQQVGTGTKGRQPDGIEPCCNVTAIDLKTGVITAKVTKTGKTFTLTDIPAAALAKFTVGGTIDLSCAVPPSGGTSGTTGVTGNAACGSNVPRNADTRPKDCIATSSTGVQTPIACPQNVPIKSGK